VTGPGEHDHTDLLAYGLGKLDDDEEQAVRDHLATCSDAREEFAELRATAAQIDEVPPEMFLDGAPDADTPGEFGLQRALSRIREEERRGHRQRRTRLLAAAAALLLVVGGGSALLGRASVPYVIVAAPVPAVEQPAGRLVTGSNGQIGAAAVVTPAAGWVRIAVTATGLPSGERCSVVVVARDGTEAIAATWVVPPVPNEGGTTINGSASIRDADVAAIAIRGQTGAPLVSMPV
jgi:anti-sigma factor RsiW